MLTHLSIRNIVLIEACDIALGRGLCVLTGETGAGKSILLDALGLALGGRGDASLVRQGETSGSVSAEFDISGNIAARGILAELEIQAGESLIVRRSIGADGKTRALVNDQPVSVAGLRRLGEVLVEIHGQHDQRGLQDGAVHRALLDEYGELGAKRAQVRLAHQRWRQVENERQALIEATQRHAREQEYLRHMRGELHQLAVQPGEEEELAQARTRMMQSEKTFELLSEALSELHQGKGVTALLRSAQRALARSALSSSPEVAQAIEALERAAGEAEEAADQLEKLGSSLAYDPALLERIEERLFALKAAARKYNLCAAELPGLLDEVESKLTQLDSQEHALAVLERTVVETRAEYMRAARALSEVRGKAAVRLEKAMEKELAPLKMGGTRFRAALYPLTEALWSEWGMENVVFEAATNVAKVAGDIAYAPLGKIASGGELSRFMLAMKVALAGIGDRPTFVFDEVDAGTGGAVADAIGKRLASLGRSAQVLVVTHLPQVAARGGQHLRVYKRQKAGRITTVVEMLDDKAREEELARMLSGAAVTAEARRAAQKLLEDAV